jgi:carbamoyl-phosphate synthase large subunit
VAVKESVFPFVKFPGVDTLLGPEMKSTGEVMGIDVDFATAFAKAQLGAGVKLPVSGEVFISVRDADKKHVVSAAQKLYDAGFKLVATRGTASFLQEKGLDVKVVNKVLEGRPHIVDSIKNGDISMVINTTQGAQAVADSFSIRRNALMHGVTYFTTIAGAKAAVDAILAISREELGVKPLQDYLQ